MRIAAESAVGGRSPTIGAVIPVWRRYDILRICVMSLRTQTVLVSRIVLVGSRDARMEALAGELGCEYVDVPNHPLGAKWNAGFWALRGTDVVLVSGSDNVYSPGWVEHGLTHLGGDVVMAGSRDLHILDGATGRLVRTGHANVARRDPVGAGRLVRGGGLDRVEWRYVPDELERSLDAASHDRLCRACPELRSVCFERPESLTVLDVKDPLSVTPFRTLPGTEPRQVDTPWLAEHFSPEVVRALAAMLGLDRRLGVPARGRAHPGSGVGQRPDPDGDGLGAVVALADAGQDLGATLASLNGVADAVVVADMEPDRGSPTAAANPEAFPAWESEHAGEAANPVVRVHRPGDGHDQARAHNEARNLLPGSCGWVLWLNAGEVVAPGDLRPLLNSASPEVDALAVRVTHTAANRVATGDSGSGSGTRPGEHERAREHDRLAIPAKQHGNRAPGVTRGRDGEEERGSAAQAQGVRPPAGGSRTSSRGQQGLAQSGGECWELRVSRRSRGVWRYPVQSELTGVQAVVLSGATVLAPGPQMAMGTLARAVPTLRRLHEQTPDDPHAPYWLAHAAVRAENWPEALSWCQTLADICPNDPGRATFWVWYVRATLATGGLAAAMQMVREALTRHPGYGELWHLRLGLDTAAWLKTAADPGPYLLNAQHSAAMVTDPDRLREGVEALALPLQVHVVRTGAREGTPESQQRREGASRCDQPERRGDEPAEAGTGDAPQHHSRAQPPATHEEATKDAHG